MDILFVVSAGVPGFLGYENRLREALGFDCLSRLCGQQQRLKHAILRADPICTVLVYDEVKKKSTI